jgi:hypothetical protein
MRSMPSGTSTRNGSGAEYKSPLFSAPGADQRHFMPAERAVQALTWIIYQRFPAVLTEDLKGIAACMPEHSDIP